MNNRMFYRAVLLTAAIILVYASTASVAHASNLCVHPQGAGQCYDSIQAAVDAASDGDQIIIRPGKYVEQVVIIDKDLTLIGREGAVIQAFPGMEETLSEAIEGFPGHPIIGVVDAEVTIRGLTIDGANLAEGNLFLDGIDLINAGGVIQDNVIKNVGFGQPTLPLDPEGNPILQGDGIFVLNFSATPRTVTVLGNRIVNFNNNGMTLVSIANEENPDVANLTLHVARNTIIGAGPNDVIDQFGIFLLSDLFTDPSFYATATITDNHIRDLATVDPYPLPGSGIVTVNTTNLDVSKNQVHNVNVGIEAATTYNSQIWRNHLIGTGKESSGTVGIGVSGDNIQVNQNRIQRFETGIALHVTQVFFGPANAANTSLNDNHFDNVGVEIMTGPAPVEPELGVAVAVQASSKLQSYLLRFRP
jgi:nitrous oxidase accessory protein NosD